ncbi:MAG TPA: hypothetical protein VG168_06060 [Bryobacteraceae bacterium]|jgi:hypothetical protein|nr:hypothetical protein [Bryobacteraceae bacterium]
MDQQESWGLPKLNKLGKGAGHRTDVSRNKYTPVLGRDPKNFRITSAVRDNATGNTKID